MTQAEIETELTAITTAKADFIAGGMVYKFHKGDLSMTFLKLSDFNDEIDRLRNELAVMKNNKKTEGC